MVAAVPLAPGQHNVVGQTLHIHFLIAKPGISQIKLIFRNMCPLGWLGYGTMSASTATAFKRHSRGENVWWSYNTADGKWCREK